MSSKRPRNVEQKLWLKFFSNGRFKSSEAQCVVHTVKGSKMTICLHDTGVMQLDTHNFEKASKLIKKANERVMRSGDRIEWKDPWYLTLSYQGVPLSDLDVGVVVNPALEEASKYTFEAYQQAETQCNMADLDAVSALLRLLVQTRNSELMLMDYERETRESQLTLLRASIEGKRREIEEATKVLKAMSAQFQTRSEDTKHFLEEQQQKRTARVEIYGNSEKRLESVVGALRKRDQLSDAYTDMLMAKGALDILQQNEASISQAKLAQARQALADAEKRFKELQ